MQDITEPGGSQPGENIIAPPAPHPGSFLALLRGRFLLVAIVVLTALFILLTALVLRADLKPTEWDAGITHEMQEFPRFPIGEILIAVSWPGFMYQNWIIPGVIILSMFLVGWRTEAAFTALATLGGFAGELVKVIINRPRPDVAYSQNVLVSVAHGPSFPSGHVTSYVVFYGFLFYLAYTLLPRRSVWRWIIMILCGLMVLLVGPSRVYMGQHWTSDALAGYSLGFIYLLSVIALYRFWMRRHPKAPIAPSPTPPG